jgi:hypothetical protein
VALLGLPGLSVRMEAELCMAVGQYRRALQCCTAVMMGCEDRTHLAASRAFAGRVAAAQAASGVAPAGGGGDGVGVGGAGLPAGLPAAAAAAASQQAKAPIGAAALWTFEGRFDAYIDPLDEAADEKAAAAKGSKRRAKKKGSSKENVPDWGAPLRQGWSFSAKPPSAVAAAPGANGAPAGQQQAAATAAAAAAGAAVSALQPLPSAVALTIRLVQESQQAGITDVTEGAARLLIQHKDVLTPAQLARLAARMAEAGLHQEVASLVEAAVQSGSHSGQAVGFVAAALTGSLDKLQAALQHSGTVSLAALQANTYRLSNAAASEAAWNAALQQSAGIGEGGSSGAFMRVQPF